MLLLLLLFIKGDLCGAVLNRKNMSAVVSRDHGLATGTMEAQPLILHIVYEYYNIILYDIHRARIYLFISHFYFHILNYHFFSLYAGTCIVLSGMGDRAFVTNRGCVDKMSLSWFKPRIEDTAGINHFHSSGYFNCTTIRSELPLLFQHVSYIS